jgi:hypothetical protein
MRNSQKMTPALKTSKSLFTHQVSFQLVSQLGHTPHTRHGVNFCQSFVKPALLLGLDAVILWLS